MIIFSGCIGQQKPLVYSKEDQFRAILVILATILMCLLIALTTVELYRHWTNHKHRNKVSDTKRPFFRYGWNTLKFWRKP